MPLETATYTSQLVTANPAHTDGLSQADSHMRLLKSTILATFPNFTAVALNSSQAQIDAAVSYTTGATAYGFQPGTALLPGLFPLGNPNTGFFSPATNQIAVTLNGAQVMLMGAGSLVTSLSIVTTGVLGAAAIASTGAFSGGTGQLVPIGATLLWWDDVLPTEGGYAWANGQIIASANTVCPVLLARWGSRFGGNGATTMGVPDLRDTVPVGKSTMGGVASRALLTLGNTVLGTLIGLANTVLLAVNLPPYTPAGTNAVTVTSGSNGAPFALASGGGVLTFATGGSFTSGNVFGSGGVTITSAFTGTAQGGTSTAFNNTQPSTTCNYIIRLA